MGLTDANIANRIAWVSATSTDPALQDAGRAVEMARLATDLAKQESTFWNTLGVALYVAGSYEESLEALDKAMALSNGGSAVDWLFVAMAKHHLGLEDGHEWLEKAVDWMAAHKPADEELQRFRAEAEDVLGTGRE